MKKEISSMIVIPPKKIKSKGDTIQMFLADQDKFKTFYRDVRAYLKSTQHIVSRKDTRMTPGYASTAGIMNGQTQSRFVASIISVISEDWIGEERGRFWKSC